MREAVLAPDGRPVALFPRRRVAWGPPGVGGRVWTGPSASQTRQSADPYVAQLGHEDAP